MKSGIAREKVAFNMKLVFISKVEFNLRKKILQRYFFFWGGGNFVWYWKLETSESRSAIPGKILNVVLVKDAEDQLRTVHVRNEEMLHRVKEESNYLTHNKRRKATSIGHI